MRGAAVRMCCIVRVNDVGKTFMFLVSIITNILYSWPTSLVDFNYTPTIRHFRLLQ